MTASSSSGPSRGRWPWMVAAVAGASMEPTLRAGDAVLVRRTTQIHAGDVVVCRRPDRPDLLVVKRVTRRMNDTDWWVEGDNLAQSHDSWVFGEVPADLIVGRVVLCYRPGWPRRVK